MHTHTLTSAQILEALRQEGLTVTDAQLGRWYREGLLIERERKGRGRGLGVDWYWGEDTLERVRIIATTLQSKGPTFEDAGKALLLHNYQIQTEKMRTCLIAIIDDLETLHKRRQSYLTSSKPQEEKENKLKRSLQKRPTWDLAPGTILLFYLKLIVNMFNIDHPFSFCSMRQALQQLSDQQLSDIATEAYAQIPAMRHEMNLDALWIAVRPSTFEPYQTLETIPMLPFRIITHAVVATRGMQWVIPFIKRMFPKKDFPEQAAAIEHIEHQLSTAALPPLVDTHKHTP